MVQVEGHQRQAGQVIGERGMEAETARKVVVTALPKVERGTHIGGLVRREVLLVGGVEEPRAEERQQPNQHSDRNGPALHVRR